MTELFGQIVGMSFTASVVILFVLVVRGALGRAPKAIAYALWSVVLFRLVCPFSFESRVSLLGVAAIPQAPAPGSPLSDSSIAAVTEVVNAVLPAAAPYVSASPLRLLLTAGSVIWLVGIASLLLYSIVSLKKLQARLRDATHERDNIYRSAAIDTPFVMGMLRPTIYLPAGLGATETAYILLHEQTHIRRLDHLVKLASFAVLCVHWFNPLVWVAFFASGRDMEMSCDESVVRRLGAEVKQDYSSSLLTLATGRRLVGGTPLAFGEGDTKSRIKNILNYKKPAFWVMVIAIAAVVALSLALAANPSTARAGMQWAQNLKVSDVQSIELVVTPSSPTDGYLRLEPAQFEEIVGLANQSRGKYVAEPEWIEGRGMSLYINTTDGKRHCLSNNGNRYLVIDGESYEASYSQLSKWDFSGNAAIPADFDYDISAASPTAVKLWEARTDYVGDNSAVGKIIGLLPVPEGTEYDHFKLQTSVKPYQIEVVYKTTAEQMASYDRDLNLISRTITKNAQILLALVDNADTVITTVMDGNRAIVFASERADANKAVGGDVRDFAESAKKVEALMEWPQMEWPMNANDDIGTLDDQATIVDATSGTNITYVPSK